jgi:hypothetical protein
LGLLTVISVLGACSDPSSPAEVATFALEVRVEYPPTYAQQGAEGARVILTSTERNTADTAVAGVGGLAAFTRVIPGSYTVSASRDISAVEAEQLTGQAESVTLNGIAPAQSFLERPTTPPVLRLSGSRLGDLVIKEVYYTGSKTPSGGNYFSDQFVEIYNNATDTVFLDGLLIGDAFGNSGQINPASLPTPYQDDQSSVHLSSIWRVPGTGTQHPLAPGASIIIAQDGINHRTDPNGNALSPVDLGTANWETFNARDDGRDLDAPAVPNLARIIHRGGFDWLITVFGPGVVIFRAPDVAALDTVLAPGSTATYRTRVPNALVIDAFEALQNGASGPYKRLPAAIDAGFVFAGGTYTSQSARRKVARVVNGRRVLQDTNNSTNDFEIITPPTPRGFGQ